MAKKRERPTISTLDKGILEISSIDELDSGLEKQKRDTVTAHTDTKLKQIKVNEALGLPVDDILAADEKNKTEFADIERDLLEIDGTETEAQEIVEGDFEVSDEEKGIQSTETQKRLQAKVKAKIAGDSAVLNGLGLTQPQRKFVIGFCNPESQTYNDKFTAFIKAGYSAKNRNTLIANVSKLLGNEKIKKAMDLYRRDMINSKKFEISTESINILRKRATYDVTYFYENDGSLKPLDKIPEEWRCCIDAVDLDYKGAQANQKVTKYKVCNRDKALDALNKILEIQQALGNGYANASKKDMQITAALDTGQDKNGIQGPRVALNITVTE